MHQTVSEERQADTTRLVPARAVTVQTARSSLPWRQFLAKFIFLALLWAVLTDFRLDALIFGIPAVLLGAGLVFILPARPGWWLSLRGFVEFALWFAGQSIRGAVDVAWRAFTPTMPLDPGFRSFASALPDGAPRILFLNAITLLPGTLSAELSGDEVVVHMLDTSADLDADLRRLERRVSALFGLTSDEEVSE